MKATRYRTLDGGTVTYLRPPTTPEENDRILDLVLRGKVDYSQLPDEATKGGPGSGNFGHAGRPGKVGGSATTSAGGLRPVGSVDHTPAKIVETGNRRMTSRERRETALGAARGLLRKLGSDPAQADANDALLTLDDLARSAPDTVAAQWYMTASDAQVERFRREWSQWAKQQDQAVEHTATPQGSDLTESDIHLPRLKLAGTSGELQQRARERVEKMRAYFPGVEFSSCLPNPAGLAEAKKRGIPGVGLPQAIYTRNMQALPPLDDQAKLQCLTDAYRQLVRHESMGYVETNALKFGSGLSYQDTFALLNHLRSQDPHYVSASVDRLGQATHIKLNLPRAALKGGPGSGNFGHAGRPGKVGGSASSGGGAVEHTVVPAAEARSWAAGTQVTDEAGQPLVVYHGTDAKVQFEDFRPGKAHTTMQLGFGIHFAADEGFAKGARGRVLPVYLQVHKLLKADAIYEEGTPEFALAETLAKKGRRPLMALRMETGKRGLYLQGVIDSVGPKLAEREIRAAGYDGVRYEATVLSFNGPPGTATRHGKAVSYVVFDNSQVRIIREAQKGSASSGNWGHAGMAHPGKHGGGSAPGGGAAQSLARYLGAYQGALPRPVRAQITTLAEDYVRQIAQARGQEVSGSNLREEAESIADVMSLGPEQFQRWGAKIGLADSGDLARQYTNEDQDAERQVLRQRLLVQDRFTLKDERGQIYQMNPGYPDEDAPLVGSDAHDAAHIITGMGLPSAQFNEAKIEAADQGGDTFKLGWQETHEALSSLVAICQRDPFAREVARKLCRYVQFEPVAYGAAASSEPNHITVGQPIDQMVWLHELAHMTDRYLSSDELSVFGKGRQVSSYSWRNQFESYAEWMGAYASQGVPRATLKAWDPAKYALCERVYQQVLAGIKLEGDPWA